MTDMIRAPWTPEQVAALNAFQQRGGMHPFTCGGDHTPGSPPLIAYTDGWRCPQPYGEACDYQQGWAHGFMADLEAWPKSPFGERHGPTPDEMRRATLIDTEVRAQLHAVIKALGVAETENKTLRAKITEIDHIINWHTTCASCARILDSAYAETVRAEKAEAAVKRVRNLAARIRQGVPWTANDHDIAAHILRALDGDQTPAAVSCSPAAAETEPNNPAAWTPPPPGDRREQLPDAILALLDIPPYTSTACQTAELLTWQAAARTHRAGELREQAGRLHSRCRLQNKFTGAPCDCPCHRQTPTLNSAAPNSSRVEPEQPERTTANNSVTSSAEADNFDGYLAPDPPIGCLNLSQPKED